METDVAIDDFDRAALELFRLEFDAEGFYRTWDEIHARMVKIERARAERVLSSLSREAGGSNGVE